MAIDLDRLPPNLNGVDLMKTEKSQTETYLLTDIDRLDPVTAYVANYQNGRGKIVIQCFDSAWTHYWPAMGERSLQEFFISADNAYLLGKFLKETMQTDFDQINDTAHMRGFDFYVTSDVEVAEISEQMSECFGPDWRMDVPRCNSHEYEYVGRILNALKAAFREEINDLSEQPTPKTEAA